MADPVLYLLALAAVAAGLTGAWSPCSLSVAETLRGRLPRAAFAAGAVAGGLATFAGLALLGEAAGLAAPGVAAAVAIAAAAGEALGARIVPQVRRQVPESWRRLLPLPLAGGAYGVLLGLGWTTFVLTYAVWALAAVCVALGDVAAGLAVGAGFGIGRAVPVLAGLGAALAERPRLLRGARAADGAALAACALALVALPARAATPSTAATEATNPSAAGERLAWQQPGGGGRVQGPEGVRELPGRDPVLAGDRIAWRDGDLATVADAATLQPLLAVPVPGATAIATDGLRVVHRAPTATGGEALYAGDRVLYSVGSRRQIGRPSMSGDRVVFHATRRARPALLLEVDVVTGQVRRLRSHRLAQLLHPTLDGDRIVYVQSTATRQKLRYGDAGGSLRGDRTLWSTWPSMRRDLEREAGRGHHRHYPSGRPPRRAERPPSGVRDTLFTTALGPATAYVTRLRVRRGVAGHEARVLAVDLAR